MAVPFLSSITLNKNEVQDFKVFNYAGDVTPLTGTDIGYFWTNTTGGKTLRWWDGSAVRTVLDSASTTIVAADLSGGAAGSLPYQIGTGNTDFLGIGTSGQVLSVKSDLSGPEWVNQSSLSVGLAVSKPGGALGSLLVQTGVGTTDFLTVGTAGQVLTSNGASPAYVNQSTLSVGSATTATTATTANHISGGAAGELLYQSGLATTAKLGVGTDGYILTYDGTNTKPKWSASIPAGSVSGLAASATTDTTNAANITSGLLPLARLALATGQFYVGDASNNPAATAKSSISLTGFGALTADLDIAGFNIINSGNVTSGSSGSTLATKGYVDSVAQGLDIKASCLVASTADINLSAPGSGLIDGIDPATFTSGTTRILVKDQSLSQQNGIYIWNGTGSAMTRSLDANTWDELVGAFTFIETGTANADSGWVCTANAGGTLGTTPVPFVKFSQAGSYTAGNGMVLSGGVFHFAQDTNYTEGEIPYASSTTAIGFKAVTGTGNVVLATDPTLAGTPLSTTAAADTNTTQIATTAFVIGQASAATPAALGTAAVGTSLKYARADHVHALPTIDLASGVSGTLPVANGGTGAATFTAGQVLFGNGTSAINSSSNLFWDNSNNRLGIGTASPADPLDVNGASTLRGNITIASGSTSYGTLWVTSNTLELQSNSNATSGLRFKTTSATPVVFATNGSDRLTLDSSGNLGLGAVSPGQRFFVQSAAASIALFNSTAANGPYLTLQSSGTAFCDIGSAKAITDYYNATDLALNVRSAGSMYFCVNYAPKMTLDSSGNLLIGSTSLVNGPLQVGNTSMASSYLQMLASPTGFSAIHFGDAGAGTAGSYAGYIFYDHTSNYLSFATDSVGRFLMLGGQFMSYSNGTASAPVFSRATDGNTGLYFPTGADTLALAVGGSDAVYIDSSRNVGIGIIPATSTRRLIVYGSAAAATNTALALQTSTSGTTATDGFTMELDGTTAYLWNYENNAILFGTNNAERLRIKSTGQLNFTGLASAPTGAVGDLYYNSATDSLQLYSGAWNTLTRKISAAGVGTGATITVTHNWGTRDVLVQVRNSSHAQVLTDVTYGEDSVTVTFADSNTTLSNYTVTVIG